MTILVRFAPSPTGRLHVGNIRTALINWLYAHRHSGRFMLRLDDTDVERSTSEFARAICDDLEWLGLNWDIEAKQSDRFERYSEIVEGLKDTGRLYACYESGGELERKRKRQMARGLPPVYDRAALKLTDDEKRQLEDAGKKPHWRFLLQERNVAWDDLVRGNCDIDASTMSDPVLIRADGSYLYTLPSVVDDIDFKVSHVIRGEDHVANTATQIQLFEALGASVPTFAHHNLLIGADGKALSKRAGSLSIESFRAEGLEPLAVVSHAATIGTSDPVAAYLSLDEIAAMFDFGKLSRAPARFDADELRALNARLLHLTPFDMVASRLAAMGCGGNEAFWLAVRPNIAVLSDVERWWNVAFGNIVPVIEDAEFCQMAAKLLPPEPWDQQSWKNWTDAVKAKTGVKGRALFHPLRLAVTGLEQGPELKLLLPLIGRARIEARLAGNSKMPSN